MAPNGAKTPLLRAGRNPGSGETSSQLSTSGPDIVVVSRHSGEDFHYATAAASRRRSSVPSPSSVYHLDPYLPASLSIRILRVDASPFEVSGIRPTF